MRSHFLSTANAVSLFLVSLALLLAHVLGDAWLSVRCVEAGGTYERGWYFDTCKRVAK